MNTERILVVDDEEDIVELISYNLAREGYRIIKASSGETALKLAKSELPDIIILDLMLSGINGLEVAKILKNNPATAVIPIIMLTAKGEETDIIIGLELGADDYITKPFSPRILAARVKAVMRRKMKPEMDNKPVIKIHDLWMHPGKRGVMIKEKPLKMTYTEFQILYFLARQPGWVFTRYQIVNAIRGNNYSVTDRSIDVQIVGLRKKLGFFGKYIETIRGVGYRFREKP